MSVIIMNIMKLNFVFCLTFLIISDGSSERYRFRSINDDIHKPYLRNGKYGNAFYDFPSETHPQIQEELIRRLWSSLSTSPNYRSSYKDFGRRFVYAYPYLEVQQKDGGVDVNSVEELDNSNVQKYKDLNVEENNENNILHTFQKDETEMQSDPIPVKATPEYVLAIAKQSALLEETKPHNPADEMITKEILRSGNYWNSFWKEEVDPEKILRSKNVVQKLKKPFKKGKGKIPKKKIVKVLKGLKLAPPQRIVVNKKYNFGR